MERSLGFWAWQCLIILGFRLTSTVRMTSAFRMTLAVRIALGVHAGRPLLATPGVPGEAYSLEVSELQRLQRFLSCTTQGGGFETGLCLQGNAVL